MPIDDSELIETVMKNVRRDVISGFDDALSADGDDAFSIALEPTTLEENLVVATSDAVIVVPWIYRCVHTGVFLDVPPTFVHFELRGATVVNLRLFDDGIKPNEDGERPYLYHRFVDFLCALHHIGVSTSVRPALEPKDFLNWQEAQRPR